jgi:hypothetical protein
MELTDVRRSRFQYSLRSLFVVTAVFALLLVPVAWVTRERQRMLEAREAALRAVVLAEHDRARAIAAEAAAAERNAAHSVFSARSAASPTPNRSDATGGKPLASSGGRAARAASEPPETTEQLVRENAELKKTIERLKREIQRLKVAR